MRIYLTVHAEEMVSVVFSTNILCCNGYILFCIDGDIHIYSEEAVHTKNIVKSRTGRCGEDTGHLSNRKAVGGSQGHFITDELCLTVTCRTRHVRTSLQGDREDPGWVGSLCSTAAQSSAGGSFSQGKNKLIKDTEKQQEQ